MYREANESRGLRRHLGASHPVSSFLESFPKLCSLQAAPYLEPRRQHPPLACGWGVTARGAPGSTRRRRTAFRACGLQGKDGKEPPPAQRPTLTGTSARGRERVLTLLLCQAAERLALFVVGPSVTVTNTQPHRCV